MPLLKNQKWERFAQELAKGKTAGEAYVLAGYKANDGNAIRLKGNERLLARVQELLGRSAARAEVTVASILNGLRRPASLRPRSISRLQLLRPRWARRRWLV
jgi:phage terminase small subunit